MLEDVAQRQSVCVGASILVCGYMNDLELLGTIRGHGLAAEWGYGTTGCGGTLPGGFCVE